MIARVLSYAIKLASFSQVLLYLPLALDIAGKDCLLALSLALSVLFGLHASLVLATRNTRLRALATLFTGFAHVAIPALLLTALNVFSSSAVLRPSAGALSWQVGTAKRWRLLRVAVRGWETFLTTSSPVFTILEGVATLLCIQAMSRFTSTRISRSEHPDGLQVLFLITAAVIYVTSAYFLVESYDQTDPPMSLVSATLTGVAVTSIAFLSAISFAVRKANVVETSLVLAYAVFQIYHLGAKPGMPLLQHVLRSSQSNGHPPLPPLVLQSFDAIASFVSHTFGAGLDFVTAASSALPLPVLVGLFYRVAVLYAASRIVLALKRRSEFNAVEPVRLSEEEPAARMMTILVAYSRLILTAVYTHLLLLSNYGYSNFWRWINIFLTIGLWGIELSIGGDNDTHWKED